jgi:DNA-directed RNA polymerase specialized sigma24 family protein
VKDKIKLGIEQAAMRARHATVAQADVAEKPDPRVGATATIAKAKTRPTEKPDLHLLKRRLAATVLCFDRGWTATEIARVFQWPVADVRAWFEAGKTLL